MSASKIGMGVAAGYLLGRTKRLRLAITVGSMLAGQRVATNPQALLRQLNELAEKNPDVAALRDRVKNELFEAVKSAAMTQMTDRLESANRSLSARSGSQSDEDEDEDGSEDEPEGDAQDEADDEADEPRTRPSDEAERRRGRRGRRARRRRAPGRGRRGRRRAGVGRPG